MYLGFFGNFCSTCGIPFSSHAFEYIEHYPFTNEQEKHIPVGSFRCKKCYANQQKTKESQECN